MPCETQYLNVNADHVATEYACHDAVFQVSPSPAQNGQIMWSAWHPKYGCGKDYPTPEQAVRDMLRSHACTNIRITPADQSAWDAQRSSSRR
jgi:hypothetical protein